MMRICLCQSFDCLSFAEIFPAQKVLAFWGTRELGWEVLGRVGGAQSPCIMLILLIELERTQYYCDVMRAGMRVHPPTG